MFGNPSYPTYQAFLGLGIAAAIALLLMPWWIKLLKVEGIGQQVRADGPKRHVVKQGTPTMGGVVILVAISLTCLLMGKLTTELVLVLLATLATGVLGLIDDLTSVTHGRSLGLTPHAKMIGLTIICVTFTVLAVNWCGVAPEIRFPGGVVERGAEQMVPSIMEKTGLSREDAYLLFVHNVQGNLAVNRLLGWRRGPEFAHAQELLSAYSEGGMRAVSAPCTPIAN